jgi:hypothetical protein
MPLRFHTWDARELPNFISAQAANEKKDWRSNSNRSIQGEWQLREEKAKQGR